MRSITINITGRVYKTGYRYYVKQMAIMFGIKGYVFYNADRSVIIEASGKPSKLEKFTQYCQLGNSCSIVENMEVNNNADHPAEPFKVINI